MKTKIGFSRDEINKSVRLHLKQLGIYDGTSPIAMTMGAEEKDYYIVNVAWNNTVFIGIHSKLTVAVSKDNGEVSRREKYIRHEKDNPLKWKHDKNGAIGRTVRNEVRTPIMGAEKGCGNAHKPAPTKTVRIDHPMGTLTVKVMADTKEFERSMENVAEKMDKINVPIPGSMEEKVAELSAAVEELKKDICDAIKQKVDKVNRRCTRIYQRLFNSQYCDFDHSINKRKELEIRIKTLEEYRKQDDLYCKDALPQLSDRIDEIEVETENTAMVSSLEVVIEKQNREHAAVCKSIKITDDRAAKTELRIRKLELQNEPLIDFMNYHNKDTYPQDHVFSRGELFKIMRDKVESQTIQYAGDIDNIVCTDVVESLEFTRGKYRVELPTSVMFAEISIVNKTGKFHKVDVQFKRPGIGSGWENLITGARY